MSIAEARARRKQREEEQRAKDQAGGLLENPLAKAVIGGGLGYFSGGLIPGLAGMGASSLAPSASTVIPAFEGAISGAKAGSPIEAALAGIEKGAGPTIEKNKLGLAKKTMESAGFKPASITKDGITGYSPEMYSFKTTKPSKTTTSKPTTTKPTKTESPTLKLNRYLTNAPKDVYQKVAKARSKGVPDKDITEYMRIE